MADVAVAVCRFWLIGKSTANMCLRQSVLVLALAVAYPEVLRRSWVATFSDKLKKKGRYFISAPILIPPCIKQNVMLKYISLFKDIFYAFTTLLLTICNKNV